MELKVREKPRGFIVGNEEIDAVVRALQGADSLSYAGKNIPAFENEFAEYCGVEHAIAVSNCTVALHMAAQILRLREGDEVILTPQTFKATALPFVILGCNVKFADIDETLNVDPSTIEDRITGKTKAIFVTHLAGNAVDMDPVMDIGRKHGIPVVDDAAQSPGAEYKGKKVGCLGDMTCFSFHSLKNMSTCGEGGMITTHSDEYAREARMLRSMGILGSKERRPSAAFGDYRAPDFPLNDHSEDAYRSRFTTIDQVGLNYRMTDIQAAMGRVQLKKLDEMNRQREKIAARYAQGISRIDGFKLWKTTPSSRCVYHLYPVFIDTRIIRAGRNAVMKYLCQDCGIEVIPRFFPVHLSSYMQAFGHQLGECPRCERIFFEEQVNLPISASMSMEEVDDVVGALEATARHFRERG